MPAIRKTSRRTPTKTQMEAEAKAEARQQEIMEELNELESCELPSVSQYALKKGTVLRVQCAEEQWGSVRVDRTGFSFRLYEYNHQGDQLGKNGNYYYSVFQWLESFDEDSQKLGVKIAGRDEYVNITEEFRNMA